MGALHFSTWRNTEERVQFKERSVAGQEGFYVKRCGPQSLQIKISEFILILSGVVL